MTSLACRHVLLFAALAGHCAGTRAPSAGPARRGPNGASPPIAAERKDVAAVRTIYTEGIPFTNKTTVELIGVNRGCKYALLEVVCAPPALTDFRGPHSDDGGCPPLALDAIDYERGTVQERWVATPEVAHDFTQYADVEGGRAVDSPQTGLPDVMDPDCAAGAPASRIGAELRRLATHPDSRVVDSYDAPEMAAWKAWMGSARDGVPKRIDRPDVDALVAGATIAQWSGDRQHLYVSGRWEWSRCLYDLAIDNRAGEMTATRRSFCANGENTGDTLFALGADGRWAVRLTIPGEADPRLVDYSLFDLRSGDTQKEGRLAVGPLDTRARPALSDAGILWISRRVPEPPLLVDLICGTTAAVDAPSRVGVTGSLRAIPRPGPGVARPASALWIDGASALTMRLTDDGRDALVLINAPGFLPLSDRRLHANACGS